MTHEVDSLSWICCQVTAREHYAIPRALHSAGRLHELITDVWSPPGRALIMSLDKRARERFHAELDGADISSWNVSALAIALRQKVVRRSLWSDVISRNNWFQRKAIRQLESIRREHPSRQFVVFAYSYAALRILAFAKGCGWLTVLGQIDPGIAEERIVARLHRESSLGRASAGGWSPAPDSYWKNWHAECEIADAVVVNSEWSRQGLVREGVPLSKIDVIPLVMRPPAVQQFKAGSCPDRFTAERPLRLLFLGQAGIRKGIELIIRAADELAGEPVEIRIVGPIQIPLTSAQRAHPALRWIGNVPRSMTESYYREADAFLFPTFSDGFGLTQLEAQAWGLPLIVSRFCGKVVDEGINGLVVDPLSVDSLVATIRRLLRDPAEVRRMSGNSALRPEHRIEGLARRLAATIQRVYLRA